jgi:archaellum component FlaC
MKLFVGLMFFSIFAQAQIPSGYLTPEQQKYYKNDSFEGNNQRERIDSAVIELNKIHGELAGMKAEIQTLKKEIEELKQKK